MKEIIQVTRVEFVNSIIADKREGKVIAEPQPWEYHTEDKVVIYVPPETPISYDIVQSWGEEDV